MKANPCRYCHGTARVTYTASSGVKHVDECTSCNGTGIDGDPFWLFIILTTAFAVTVGLILLFLFPL